MRETEKKHQDTDRVCKTETKCVNGIDLGLGNEMLLEWQAVIVRQ